MKRELIVMWVWTCVVYNTALLLGAHTGFYGWHP